MKTLVEMLQKSVASFAQDPLFGMRKDGQWVWLSFREFDAQVEACTAVLADLGLKHGDRLALISNNRVEWAMSAYAAYQLGAAIVPMYEAQHSKEWEYILHDSGAIIAVVGTEAIAQTIKGMKAELPALQHVLTVSQLSERVKQAKGGTTKAPITEQDVACVLYTSGTTGKPKGVILTHGNFMANVNAVQSLLPLRSGDVALSFLPWAHA